MTAAQPDQARRVGIVGAGVIGGGWALHYLRTGFDVDVYDPAPHARADLLRMVEASWPLLDRMGLREGASPDRLTFHDSLAPAVTDADMVQENAPEDGPVKRRVLAEVDRAARPGVVIIVETEIWPNFLREARRKNVPVVFVSGRISDRSFARYQKYLGILGFFLRPFLASALQNAAAFLMQTGIDADRICALGAPPERVRASGNLKYDMELPAPTPLSDWLKRECEQRGRWPVVVAGSVVATEEPLALIAFGVVQGDFPKALLVLAPRKPERFGAAAEFIEESHRKFVKRSAFGVAGPGIPGQRPADSDGIPDDVTVLLLDSIGELASLYRLADSVFVGGSLVEAGGHNILEPAAFGKVPVFGPSMENFAAIAERFVEAGAAIQVASPEDAGVEWIHLLKDARKMERMGAAAQQLVENSRGALHRALEEVRKQLTGGPAR